MEWNARTATAVFLVVTTLTTASADGLASKKLSDSTSYFAVNLLKDLSSQQTGNVVFSPLSITSVLAMLAQGAREESARQLENLLRLTKEEALVGYGQMVRFLKKRRNNSSSVLELASRTFLSDHFLLEPEFRETLQQNFASDLETVDFRQSAVAATRVNNWVSTETRGRITAVVDANTLSANTQLILANAVFFKGLWQRPFNARITKLQDFSTEPGVTVSVPFMYQSGNFRAGEDPRLGAHWVELPFDGEEFSMVIVLPTRPHRLSDVVNNMTRADLGNMVATRGTKHVQLLLPRFKLDTQTALVPALQMMGLTNVFNVESDLTGITKSSEPLVVSDILQKAQVEIDERGGSAAAATVVVVNTLSLAHYPEQVVFEANQPFLAVIVDRVNAVPLFVGRVSNPALT